MQQFNVTVNGRVFEVELIHKVGTSVSFLIAGKRYDTDVAPHLLRQSHEANSSKSGSIAVAPPPRAQTAKTDAVYAPMPGIIVSIAVKAGDEVQLGQTVLVMEAMKMENNVASPRAGKVKSVAISPGQEVGNQQLLISFE